VIVAPWTDDFSAARNIALDHANGAWVLTLDADETLGLDAVETLASTTVEAAAPALRLPIEEIGLAGEVEAIHFAVRLFRRAAAHRWQRPVCERVTAAATEYAALPIQHHGYASATDRYAKLDRNRMLLERAIVATPTDPELRQRLAWSLLQLGDPYAAAAHAEAALRRTRSTMTGLLAIGTCTRAALGQDLVGAVMRVGPRSRCAGLDRSRSSSPKRRSVPAAPRKRSSTTASSSSTARSSCSTSRGRSACRASRASRPSPPRAPSWRESTPPCTAPTIAISCSSGQPRSDSEARTPRGAYRAARVSLVPRLPRRLRRPRQPTRASFRRFMLRVRLRPEPWLGSAFWLGSATWRTRARRR
jgi:hypothetical protein